MIGIINTRFYALLLLVGIIGEGCHGGGGSTGLLPQVSSQNGTGTASFAIAVPAHDTSTQSLVVSLLKVNGVASSAAVAPVRINISANASGCTGASNGSLTCTATLAAPAGKDTFSVVTYAQPNGTGAQVSASQPTTVITPGSKNVCTPTSSGGVSTAIISQLLGGSL